MKPRSPDTRRWPGLGAVAFVLLGAAIATAAVTAVGQPASSVSVARPAASKPGGTGQPAAARAEEGIRWHKLKPAQREALMPLQHEWAGIDAVRKQKWVQVADRLPAMPPEERARVQARMSDWARLTPAERGEARLRFQEAKQIAPPDRRSRWEAYQALTPEQKHELAERAAPPARSATAEVPTRRAGRPERIDKAARDASLAKSNIVPNPAYAPPPRVIAPTVVQAAPGATTTLMTRRPAPPPHQHTGLPKIAATPEFVNKSTLLPQRGAQGAAIRPVPAGDAPTVQR